MQSFAKQQLSRLNLTNSILSFVKMIKLDCAVQQYAWGKDGVDSSVAKLKKSVNSLIILVW